MSKTRLFDPKTKRAINALNRAHPQEHYANNKKFGFAQAFGDKYKDSQKQEDKYAVSETALNQHSIEEQGKILRDKFKEVNAKILSNHAYDNSSSTLTYARADLMANEEGKQYARVVTAYAGDSPVYVVKRNKNTGEITHFERVTTPHTLDDSVGLLFGRNYKLQSRKVIDASEPLEVKATYEYTNLIGKVGTIYRNETLMDVYPNLMDETEVMVAQPGPWRLAPSGLMLTNALGGQATKDSNKLFRADVRFMECNFALEDDDEFHVLVASDSIEDVLNNLTPEGKKKFMERVFSKKTLGESAQEALTIIEERKKHIEEELRNLTQNSDLDQLETFLDQLGMDSRHTQKYLYGLSLDVLKQKAETYAREIVGSGDNLTFGILPLDRNVTAEPNAQRVISSTAEAIVADANGSFEPALIAQQLYLSEVARSSHSLANPEATQQRSLIDNFDVDSFLSSTPSTSQLSSPAIPPILANLQTNSFLLEDAAGYPLDEIDSGKQKDQQPHIGHMAYYQEGNIGFAQIYGERSTQEDRYSARSINTNSAPDKMKKERILKAVFNRVNQQSKKALTAKTGIAYDQVAGGSTLAYVSAATVKENDGIERVYVTTAHSGDSAVYLVLHDENETQFTLLTKPHTLNPKELMESGKYYFDPLGDVRPEVQAYFRSYQISTSIPADENDIQPYHIYVQQDQNGLKYKVKNNKTSKIHEYTISISDAYKKIYQKSNKKSDGVTESVFMQQFTTLDIGEFTKLHHDAFLRYLRSKHHVDKCAFTYNTISQQCHIGGQIEVAQSVADFDCKNREFKREVEIKSTKYLIKAGQRALFIVVSDGESLPLKKKQKIIREGLKSNKPFHEITNDLMEEAKRQIAIIDDYVSTAVAAGRNRIQSDEAATEKEIIKEILTSLENQAASQDLDLNQERMQIVKDRVEHDEAMNFDLFMKKFSASYFISCGSDNSTAGLIEPSNGIQVTAAVYDGHSDDIISRLLEGSFISQEAFLELYLHGIQGEHITGADLENGLDLYEELIELDSELSLADKFRISFMEFPQKYFNDESFYSEPFNRFIQRLPKNQEGNVSLDTSKIARIRELFTQIFTKSSFQMGDTDVTELRKLLGDNLFYLQDIKEFEKIYQMLEIDHFEQIKREKPEIALTGAVDDLRNLWNKAYKPISFADDQKTIAEQIEERREARKSISAKIPATQIIIQRYVSTAQDFESQLNSRKLATHTTEHADKKEVHPADLVNQPGENVSNQPVYEKPIDKLMRLYKDKDTLEFSKNFQNSFTDEEHKILRKNNPLYKLLKLVEIASEYPEKKGLQSLKNHFLELWNSHTSVLQSNPDISINRVVNFEPRLDIVLEDLEKYQGEKHNNNIKHINRACELINEIKLDEGRSLNDIYYDKSPGYYHSIIELMTEHLMTANFNQYGEELSDVNYNLFWSYKNDERLFQFLEIIRLKIILENMNNDDPLKENYAKLVDRLTEAWDYTNSKTVEGNSEKDKRTVLKDMLSDVLTATSTQLALGQNDKRIVHHSADNTMLHQRLDGYRKQLSGHRHWRWVVADIVLCFTVVGLLFHAVSLLETGKGFFHAVMPVKSAEIVDEIQQVVDKDYENKKIKQSISTNYTDDAPPKSHSGRTPGSGNRT